MTKKALVLMSGGIDSAVALYWAISKGMHCKGITFHYPGQTKSEKKAVINICKNARIELFVAKHPLIKSLNKREPFRDVFFPDNFLYYSIAFCLARKLGIYRIIGGQNKDDLIESDFSPFFYSKMNKLLGVLDKRFEVLQPLINKNKKEIVELGLRLKVPLEYTWSCQREGSKPCNICSSCKDRNKIAKELNVRL